MLGFTSLTLISKAQCCSYYLAFPLLNGVMLHAVLPEVGVGLMKAVPWLPKPMINWIAPKCHSHKDLHSLKSASRPMPHLALIQVDTQVCPTKVQVSIWC